MKRVFAVLLCSFLMLSLFSISASASTPEAEAETSLRFGDDGTFTIVQLTDFHIEAAMAEGEKQFFRDIVENIRPDLIVLTGDLITGDRDNRNWPIEPAIRSFMDVFQESNTPVTMVFGNHDAPEGNIAQKEEMLAVYESYDCFIGGTGPRFGYRIGNFNLPILASDGSGIAFNLYFFDSGRDNTDTSSGGYACVTEEQVQWYIDTSNGLKEANGGEPVPSINFQHIIVPEVFEVLEEAPSAKAGWKLPAGNDGVIGEIPCPPNHTHGQFDAFVAQGDILATVCGHEHMNDFLVEVDGVDIINTQNCTFSGYESFIMGFRVFELNEDTPWEYETYTKTWLDFYEGNLDMLLVFYASNEDVFYPVKLVAWSILNPVQSIPHWLGAIAVTAGLVVLIRAIIKKNKRKRVCA